MTRKMRFSDTEIKKLPLADTGHYYVADTEVRGLRLRIGRRDKVFCFVKRVKGGRVREVTIGPFPAVTTESAKLRVSALLQDFLSGVDPVAASEAKKVACMTFGELTDRYLADRPKIKQSTKDKFYRANFARYIPDWLSMPVTAITPAFVEATYRSLTNENTERQTAIGILFRSVNAVFEYGMEFLEDPSGEKLLKQNPILRLRKLQLIQPEKTRDRRLDESELPVFYDFLLKHIEKYKDTPEMCLVAEFLLFVLFSGCRRSEAADLRWSSVDLSSGTICFARTKTGGDRQIPVSSVLRLLLERRKLVTSGKDFVFASRSRTGRLADPHDFIKTVCRKTGLKSFCTHDLRRTFITFVKLGSSGGESDTFSALAVDFIVGHVVQTVSNRHYVRPSVRMLKPAMETLSARMLSLCGGSEPSLAAVLSVRQKPFYEAAHDLQVSDPGLSLSAQS